MVEQVAAGFAVVAVEVFANAGFLLLTLAQGVVEGCVGLGRSGQQLAGAEQGKEALQCGGLVWQGAEVKYFGAGLVVGGVKTQFDEVGHDDPPAASTHLGRVAEGLLHGRFGASLSAELLLGVEQGAGVFEFNDGPHGAAEGTFGVGGKLAEGAVGLGAIDVGFLFKQ
ncbi:hypothetical protein [Hymenobacter sp. B1770]|uniref:hypothetical protein n=1 Tax=Hymenobacter sp. B1770 TaxID=1718788 RepID=UPI003CEA9D6E